MGRRLGALALLAMLVRAVLPAGYMFATADTGSGRYLTVTLCTDHAGGGEIALVDLETGKTYAPGETPKPKDASSDTSSPCVFAGAPAVATPAAAPELIVFTTAVEAPVAIARDVRPGRGIAAPPPPATGPPLSI